MKTSKERLMKKGWSPREISKAFEIIEKSKIDKHPFIKFLDEYIYWIVLFAAIGANLFIAFNSLPFLLALTPSVLYPLLILIGLSFGWLFAIIIRDIENLEKHHQVITSLIVPIYTIIFFFLTTLLSNSMILKIKLNTPIHWPFSIGIAYSLAFISPYLYSHFIKRE